LLSVFLLHKLTRRPFCLYFYDLYQGNNFPWFFRLLARFLEPKLMNSAERVFAMCEGLAGHYRKKYGREVFVIHNSILVDCAAPPKSPGAFRAVQNRIHRNHLLGADQRRRESDRSR
jgi:hypothetical protein